MCVGSEKMEILKEICKLNFGTLVLGAESK